MNCDCYIDYYEGHKDTRDIVVYCDKHKAADDMCEALRGIVADLENIVAPHILEATLEALAKAEAQKSIS